MTMYNVMYTDLNKRTGTHIEKKLLNIEQEIGWRSKIAIKFNVKGHFIYFENFGENSL